MDLTVSDLDAEQLDSYQRAIGSSSVEEMLAARDLIDRRGNLTAAAALLFDARPQREFPSAHVRVMRYGADQRGTGSQMSLERDVRVEGSIPHQIMAASQHVQEWLPGWRRSSSTSGPTWTRNDPPRPGPARTTAAPTASSCV